MRIFADTNVLFDIFAQREPFREDAYKLIAMQMFGDVEIWTTAQSYLNILYVLSKSQNAANLQKVFVASLERINVCTTGHADLKAALLAGWDDVEDALIAQSCRSVAVDYLLSRDKKQEGFRRLGIPVLTPEEFFVAYEERCGISYGEFAL